MIYPEQKFTIPTLEGISPKQLEVHLGLYGGYVKHVNLVREKIRELEALDREKHTYAITELRRRFAFEFDGMRMHEYYFEEFEGGATSPSTGSTNSLQAGSGQSTLIQALIEKYGDFEKFLTHFKTVAMTRGIGWTVLYFDPRGRTPHTVWVGDHEVGHLAGLPVILALDMWEHAYMVDYTPSEKKQYIEAFFKNLNWDVVEKRFSVAKVS